MNNLNLRKVIATNTIGISLFLNLPVLAAISPHSPVHLQKGDSDYLSLHQGSVIVNPSLRRIKPPLSPIKPKPSPTPTAPALPAPSPTPANKSYRLIVYFEILDANDGFADNTIECYGEMRIDSELYWQIPRSQAGNNKREKSQTIEVSNSRYALRPFIINKPKIEYIINLADADSGSSDDQVYESYSQRVQLDLALYADRSDFVHTFVNRKTGESSRLHIRVVSK